MTANIRSDETDSYWAPKIRNIPAKLKKNSPSTNESANKTTKENDTKTIIFVENLVSEKVLSFLFLCILSIPSVSFILFSGDNHFKMTNEGTLHHLVEMSLLQD